MALPLTWEETTLRPYETRTVTRTRTEAEELGARTLSAYLLTRIDGAVTATRVASAVPGGLAGSSRSRRNVWSRSARPCPF